MSRPVRILLVEDSPDDAALALRALRQGGFEPSATRVETAQGLREALARERWDAVVSDFRMPGFTGLDALAIVRAAALDIPFILISGTMGEETAVAAMKSGAHDYVMKDNLGRLAPALHRELEEAATRAAHREAVRELERNEARFRCLTAMSSDFFWETDTEHRLTLRGGDRSTVREFRDGAQIGKCRWELPYLTPGEDGWRAHREVLDARRPFRGFRFSRRGADGTERHISLSGDPVFDADGRFTGYRGIGIDVTERQRAEDEVQRLNRDLERRVAERTAELEEANRELAAFDAAVSHDLRAPINRIRGFAVALLEEHGEGLGGNGRDLVGRILRASSRMEQLVGDLLGLATAARVDLARSEVDLSLVARSVFRGLAEAQPDRRVELVSAPSIRLRADPGLLRALMENVIGNAWKFTAGRDPGRIEVGEHASNGETLVFVRDNGAGFDSARAGELFAPFRRLHKQEEFPGTGLGLATVKRIVDRHGGRAWAEGEVGCGATLYFTLGGGASG